MMADHASNARAQAPLAGVVLCATSVSHDERIRLADIAIQMGATHKLDLTADVTHLVVGSIDTPKYKFVARERPDVKVILPAWVDAVREQWMLGGETDVKRLEEEHKAPVFYKLKICVTGFDDPVQRQQLVTTIERYGAEYHGDLTRAATHLVVARPSGKKYDFARQWGLRTVSIEWLDDSIRRGLALDHAPYDPVLPSAERGKGAFVEPASAAAINQEGKRKMEELLEGGPRKLRRTVSTKLGSQNESIWEDITAVSENRRRGDGLWDDVQAKPRAEPEAEKSAVDTSGLGSSILRQPKKAAESFGMLSAWAASRPRNGIFEGRIVYLHGFDQAKSNILRQHLEPNGATLLRTQEDFEPFTVDDLEQGFLVVPNDILFKDIPAVPEHAQPLLPVTNWWVEKCLYRKVLVNPLEDVTCRPFPTFQIKGFEGMVTTSTGFTNVDLLHLSKVVKLMGGAYEEYLKPETSVVICHLEKASHAKLRYAYERSIPAVTMNWLLDSLQCGATKNLADYAIRYDKDSQSSGATSTRQLSDEEKARLMSRRRKAVADQRQRQQKALDNQAKVEQLKALLDGAADSSPSQHELSLPPPTSLPPSNVAPLQEISANSPRRPSDTSTKSSNSRRRRSSTELDPEEKQLAAAMEPPPSTNTIAELLQRPRANKDPATVDGALSNLIGTDSEHAAAHALPHPHRRRRGLLGRAGSWSSNQSNNPACGASPSAGAATAAAAGTADDYNNANAAELDEVPFTEEESMLSQNLSYDDPEAQKARELMMRRIGGKVEVERGRVESVGVVTDAKKVVPEEGLGKGRRLRRGVV